MAIHNHGGRESVEFSGDDLQSHERGYPALLDIMRGVPVGALVFASDAIAGDIWLPGRRRVKTGKRDDCRAGADVFFVRPQRQRISLQTQPMTAKHASSATPGRRSCGKPRLASSV